MIRVGHVSCMVAESTQRLVAHAALASGAAVREVTVSFGSSVFILPERNGRALARPTAHRGLVGRRWNASLLPGSALVMSDDAWTRTHRLLRLDAFDLRTSTRDSGHDRVRTGFTGTAALQLAGNAPVAARHVLGTLARFAEFCGTGAQTTHGFSVTALKAAE